MVRCTNFILISILLVIQLLYFIYGSNPFSPTKQGAYVTKFPRTSQSLLLNTHLLRWTFVPQAHCPEKCHKMVFFLLQGYFLVKTFSWYQVWRENPFSILLWDRFKLKKSPELPIVIGFMPGVYSSCFVERIY
jgi:hypothetical protein